MNSKFCICPATLHQEDPEIREKITAEFRRALLSPFIEDIEEKNLTDLALTGKAFRRAAHQGLDQYLTAIHREFNNDINDRDSEKYRRTALHWAVLENKLACVRTLLDLGADVTIADYQGATPETLSKNPEITQLILDHKKRHAQCRM